MTMTDDEREALVDELAHTLHRAGLHPRLDPPSDPEADEAPALEEAIATHYARQLAGLPPPATLTEAAAWRWVARNHGVPVPSTSATPPAAAVPDPRQPTLQGLPPAE